MDKYILVRKEEIQEALKTSPAPGKHVLGSFQHIMDKGFPLLILEDSQLAVSKAELHSKEGDLALCLEGEVEFVCGGELIDPEPFDETNTLGQGIQGGEKMTLKAGDWLWVPPNVAHMHTCEGTARLGIVKIPSL